MGTAVHLQLRAGAMDGNQPQALSIVDALKNLEESVERKDFLTGYLNKIQVTEKAFPSKGGYVIIADEEIKKLLVLEAVGGKEGGHSFICHKCDDLTSMGNVQTVNMEEKNQCNHAIVAGLLFGNFEISDMDQTKNTIDLVRQDEKEVVALVVPKGGKKPGVIFGNFGKSTPC